ncbi:MAG: flavodoxin domain-containing protein [Euryarchaeota archaeon]|nr:flavodoxin domain-containing protein [Euryarchaeota archaeon]
MGKAIIVYETRSGNTEYMAKTIEAGMKEAGVEVELKKAARTKAEDLKDVDAVVLGSPTYVRALIAAMKTFLFEMEKADLKGKVGAAFGSYGWSGESIGIMTETMVNLFEMDVIEPGLKVKRRPSGKDLEECRAFGKKIAARIK